MLNLHQQYCRPLLALLLALFAASAGAQSFRVQCPATTALHKTGDGIKCQQIAGGDGFATMADGTQTYLFAFGPLSGLRDIKNGLPGTMPASVFNTPNPFTTNPAADPTADNGAVGLVPDPNLPAGSPLDGHVDPRPIMDVGVMNGNEPAPMMAIDEDDEFFLTLTNVGQIMRPDLFEQHTVHFHGYPNASAYYDGVPDASVAINIGGSFTYYYMAPDAGTYFWHCHIAWRRAARSMPDWLASKLMRGRSAATTSCAPRRCRRPTASCARPTRAARQPCTPTTTATARPPTTSSIRSRSWASIRTSTLSA
jgi:FtsP/CotA-like multicopper oxidase with cupredoxin domain